MNAPQVSVIIPTYNHRDFVLATLDSVFAQTFTDFEVIVVNDGSPDDTAQVLEPLRKSNRICYFEQPNAGQASARNRGLAEARGEFIAFLDDDDLWPRDKLEWQVQLLRERPQTTMIAGAAVVLNVATGSYSPLHPRPALITLDLLLVGNPISSPGQTLIRTSTLKQLGGFRSDTWGVDDWDLWIRVAQRGALELVPRPALLYRCHAANASNDVIRMLLNAHAVLARNLRLVEKAHRAAIAKSAYSSLYVYLGRPALRDVCQQVRRGRLSALRSLIPCMGPFLLSALRNSLLARSLAKDILLATREANTTQQA